MKVLILDVDGVLRDVNNDPSSMDPGFVCNLDRIIKETNCSIVVSSCWRIGGFKVGSDFYQAMIQACNGKEQFKRIMRAIIGKTPILSGYNRGAEIQAWIDNSNFTGTFVIVDDEDVDGFSDRLVRTSFSGDKGTTGLTAEHTNRIIDMLNG